MFSNLLPQRIDNAYRGHKLALWILALVVSVKIVQGLMVMFNGDSVVRSADGIPLDTYTPADCQREEQEVYERCRRCRRPGDYRYGIGAIETCTSDMASTIIM